MKFSRNKGVYSVTGLIGLSMQTLTRQDWTQPSLRNNVYNAKVNKGTHLDHGVAIEYTYFQ